MRQRLLFIFSLLIALSWQAMAQKEELKFNVKGDATTLKLGYRFPNVGDQATITLGNGQTATIAQKKANEIEQFQLDLTKQDTDYELTIQGDKLVTLRILGSKSVTGIKSLVSKSLIHLNMDGTTLSESPELDFSNCPNIEDITLVDGNVTTIKLPEQPKLKSLLVGPSLIGGKGLKSLDLSKCNQLKSLSLNGVSLPSIDVRACSQTLTELVIKGFNNKEYPRELFGGKDLKNLKRVSITFCAIGLDELPDLNETELEQFQIRKMYFHYVKPERISGLTVDFKNIKMVKGLSATPVETQFTWYKKEGDTWQTTALDASKVTEKDGVFTFDPSILTNGEATVRCKIDNAGYPDLAFNTTTGNRSFNVGLTDPNLVAKLNVTKESIGQDSDGEELENFEMTLQIAGEPNTKIQIDWGNGERKEYTIATTEAQQVREEGVELGNTVRIYGDITLLDASKVHLTGVVLGAKAQNLRKLRLAQNKIASLNWTKVPNLTELMITDNKFTTIDLGRMPKLSELYCGYNDIAQLALEKVSELSVLNINNNKFESLNTQSLANLEILVASDNKLTSLDLLSNKKLYSFDLMNNQLSELKLQAKELKKVLLNNNQLTAITFEGMYAPNLYAFDLGKNKLDACAINDYLMLLPSVQTPENKADSYIVKLAGNPGANTFDQTLIPTQEGQNNIVWVSDSQGDGTGCTTAKIFDLSKSEKGSAKLMIAGEETLFGAPIAKASAVTAVITPKQGYKVASVKFANKEVKADAGKENEFALRLEHNSYLIYTFSEDNAIDDVFAQAISIARVAEGYRLSGLPTGASYNLYSVNGTLIAQGTTTDGSLLLSLTTGSYILSVNDSSLKLSF